MSRVYAVALLRFPSEKTWQTAEKETFIAMPRIWSFHVQRYKNQGKILHDKPANLFWMSLGIGLSNDEVSGSSYFLGKS